MLSLDKFNVRIVVKGEGYGVNDVIIHDSETPLVEFYDSRYTRINARGQFVSRYYASTLLESENRGGLNLDGGVAGWTVSDEDIETVRQNIKEVL